MSTPGAPAWSTFPAPALGGRFLRECLPRHGRKSVAEQAITGWWRRPRSIHSSRSRLWQPWAWCITHGTKRVENRNWPPPESLVGQRFAIHAGRHYDAAGAASLAARSTDLGLLAGQLPGESDIVRGALVAFARLVGAVCVARAPSGAFVANGWIGELGPELLRAVEQSPWTQGVWGWLLDDVVPIPPIPCPGNRKLWTVPRQLAAAARAAESAARSHGAT